MIFKMDGKEYRLTVIDGRLYMNQSPIEQYSLRVQAIAVQEARKAGIYE